MSSCDRIGNLRIALLLLLLMLLLAVAIGAAAAAAAGQLLLQQAGIRAANEHHSNSCRFGSDWIPREAAFLNKQRFLSRNTHKASAFFQLFEYWKLSRREVLAGAALLTAALIRGLISYSYGLNAPLLVTVCAMLLILFVARSELQRSFAYEVQHHGKITAFLHEASNVKDIYGSVPVGCGRRKSEPQQTAGFVFLCRARAD